MDDPLGQALQAIDEGGRRPWKACKDTENGLRGERGAGEGGGLPGGGGRGEDAVAVGQHLPRQPAVPQGPHA